MAEHFDAYYKWLGIPPEEQPPNYYRLLGVRLFEADLDVIANAADQRMTHVRTFQSGKHGALSQSLLNEISAAKLSLLHAGRKAEYDSRLRTRVSAPPAAAPPPPGPAAPVGIWPPGAMPGPGAAHASRVMGVHGMTPAPGAMQAPGGMQAPGAMPAPGIAMQGGMAMPGTPAGAARPMSYPPPNPAPASGPHLTRAEPESLDELDAFESRSPRRRARKKQNSLAGPTVAALILVGVVAIGGLLLALHSGSRATTMNQSHPGQKRADPAAGQHTIGQTADLSATSDSATGQHSPRTGGQAEAASESETSAGKPDKAPKAAPAAEEPEAPALSEEQRQNFDDLIEHLKTVATRDRVQQTEAVGIEDGERFRELPKGLLLVGLELCFETEIEKRPILCGLIGHYLGDKGPIAGRLHGAAGNPRRRTKVVARPGYAMAAVDVVAVEDRLAAIRFEFRPIGAENLPKRNAYLTSWIGERGSGVPVRLGGDGRPAIGLFGWATSDSINNLGLFVPPQPAPAAAPPTTPVAAPAAAPTTAPAAPGEEPAKTNPPNPAVAATTPKTEMPAEPAAQAPLPLAGAPTGSFSEARMAAERPRDAIPSAADQARALGQIHELFKIQFNEIRGLGSSKAPPALEKRSALAEKLRQAAEKTNDDPAGRYVLFDEARKLAVQGGDAQAVVDIILATGGRFKIDDVKTTLDSLIEVEKVNAPVAYKIHLAEICMQLIDKAVSRELFDTAEQLDSLANKAAKSADDVLLTRRVGWRKARLAEQRRAYDNAQAAIDALKAAPNDAAANTAVGRYRCLVQGDWPAGLPLLAKGDNAALAALAKMELASPASPADRVKLADGWLDAAQPNDPLTAQFKGQARNWYQIALPDLSGVTRMMVVKKLEDLLGGHGLTAEYFDGAAAFDNPVRMGVDAEIDMDYKNAAPEGLTNKKFTARWTGWLAAPPKNGQVGIAVDHDGGARLWIDGKLMINAWNEPGLHQTITQFFSGKPRRLKLEYFSDGGKQPHVSLRWMQRDSFPEQAIGPEALFQEHATVEKTYSPLPTPLAAGWPTADAAGADP